MIKNILLSLIAICSFSVAMMAQPEWQSQYAIGKNKLAPHAYVWPYETTDALRSGNYEQSPFLYEPERQVEIQLGEESRPPTERLL